MGAEVSAVLEIRSLDELCSHSENITGITADLGKRKRRKYFIGSKKTYRRCRYSN